MKKFYPILNNLNKKNLFLNDVLRYNNVYFTTYSGGQPQDGQGGYYGSLETRTEKNVGFIPGYRIEKNDLEKLHELMKLYTLNNKNINNLINNQDIQNLIKRLYVHGSPLWGLSTAEREFLDNLKKSTLK